jgi:hypothetical protein
MCPDVVDRLYDPVQVSIGRVKGIVQSIDHIRTHCEDVLPLGIFTSNHDVPRFGSYICEGATYG